METWQTFSQDPVLTASIMDHALEQLKRTLPYEEKQDSRNKEKSIKYAMHLPLAVSIGSQYFGSFSLLDYSACAAEFVGQILD